MKNKQVKILAAIVAVLALSLLIIPLTGRADNPKGSDEKDLANLLIKENTLAITMGTLPDEATYKEISVNLDKAERERALSNYVAEIETIYAEKSAFRANYPAVKESILNNTDKRTDATIAGGVSNCEIEKIEYIDDHTLVVTASLDLWDKRVILHEDGKYYLSLVENHVDLETELVKENGLWKILMNHRFDLTSLESGDKAAKNGYTQVYENYPEAVKACLELEI